MIRRKFSKLCALGALTCLMLAAHNADAVTSGGSGLASSPWPDFGGGERNAGLADATAFSGPPRIRWSYDVAAGSGEMFNLAFYQPVLSEAGDVIFLTTSASTAFSSGRIHSLSPAGHANWVVTEGTPQTALGRWAAIDGEGRLFYSRWRRGASGSGAVVARDAATGASLWSLGFIDVPIRFDQAQTGPTVVGGGLDSLVIAVDDDGVVTASDPAGGLAWQVDRNNSFFVNPAVAPTGEMFERHDCGWEIRRCLDSIWELAYFPRYRKECWPWKVAYALRGCRRSSSRKPSESTK